MFGELKGRFESMYSKYSVVAFDGKYVKRKDMFGFNFCMVKNEGSLTSLDFQELTLKIIRYLGRGF